MSSIDKRARKDRKQDLRSTVTRRRIMESARELFLLNGYVGTSVDQIIAHAGVSKGQLYHHFRGKETLFNSLVMAEAERIAHALPIMDLDDPAPDSALHQTGTAVLETLYNPETVATLRLIIGTLGRFPHLGEAFLQNSLGPTVEQITAYLGAHAAVFDIEIGDNRAAVKEFTRQCLAHVIERVLVPGHLFMTEAECASMVEGILRNSILRRRAAGSDSGNAGNLPPDDGQA